MKKALIVTNLAGFFYFLCNDIDTLTRMGYQVEVAANGVMSGGDAYLEVGELKNKNLEFHQIDFNSKRPLSLENMCAYKQVKELIKCGDFDVIHCHTPIAGIITRLAARNARKNGCKVIYTTHGFAFTGTTSKKSWLVYFNVEKLCSRFSDSIITINHEDYENAKRMNCKNVYCISGVGVDTSRYSDVVIDRNEYRKRIGVKEEDIMILSIGELSVRKNHQIIIKALGQLENKEKYVYVICGREVVNSGMENLLKQVAEEQQVRLLLLGHRKDTAQIYKCADISAIPSLREGLGLAGIEALAAGVPTIGANVQGIREYIINGEDGYLCDPYHVEEFAHVISKLSQLSPPELAVMKKRCVEVSRKFDLVISKNQMKEIYSKILN